MQEALFGRITELDGVVTAPSAVSVPGARAFLLPPCGLSPNGARGPDEAFIVADVGEFAHLHPSRDGSLHLVLPIPLAHEALTKGWGAAHPLAGIRLAAGMVMIFGPRDTTELDTSPESFAPAIPTQQATCRGQHRELDGTDISGGRNVRAVEFTTRARPAQPEAPGGEAGEAFPG